MLDVHSPHEPVHGIRDFLLHLLTITVGLLIALGLEAAVEWRHHLHLRHEAEDNIRREIEDNRKDLIEVLHAVPAEQAKFKNLLVYLNARAAGSDADIHNINVGVKIGTPQDASWQTAAATGALAYMDYAEVKRFAAAYQMQKKLDTAQDASMQPIVALLGGLSVMSNVNLGKEDAAVAARQVHDIMGHVETMREFGSDLGRLYDEALKER